MGLSAAPNAGPRHHHPRHVSVFAGTRLRRPQKSENANRDCAIGQLFNCGRGANAHHARHQRPTQGARCKVQVSAVPAVCRAGRCPCTTSTRPPSVTRRTGRGRCPPAAAAAVGVGRAHASWGISQLWLRGLMAWPPPPDGCAWQAASSQIPIDGVYRCTQELGEIEARPPPD